MNVVKGDYVLYRIYPDYIDEGVVQTGNTPPDSLFYVNNRIVATGDLIVVIQKDSVNYHYPKGIVASKLSKLFFNEELK